MIKSRKAMIIEALMRIIIAIVLVVIVFKIGKNVAEAFFGGSDALKSFDDFANEINSIRDDEGKQVLLSLDKGTAVMGFSKNSKEFRCYGCEQAYGSAFSQKLLFYSIQKPDNEQCNGKPCMCICLKNLKKGNYVEDESKVSCESFSCRAIKKNIYNRISLENALKKKGIGTSDYKYPYWENGFFFVRRKNSETPLNGMIPPNDARKITLFIETNKIGQEAYVAACPELPCIQEQK